MDKSSKTWRLFSGGHYIELQTLLEAQIGTCLDSMGKALKLRNNVGVCKLMQTYKKEDRTAQLSVLYEVLQTCCSVPVKEDSMCTELIVLYNYLYMVKLLAGHEDMDEKTYRTVNRTLYRVCKLLTVPGSDLSDVIHLPSGHCYLKLIDRCLSYLQYRAGDQVTMAICMCINMMSLIHTTKDLDTTVSLEKVEAAQDSMSSVKMWTESEELLVLPVQADQQDLDPTPAAYRDWTRLLQGVCLYRSEQWTNCHNCLQNIEERSVKVVANFLSGWALYKNGQYLESVSLMMETLRYQQPVTQRLKARVYNLIGMCFSELDKVQLAIQMYKQALSTDFGFLLPLYNTSEQYRKLGKSDMELECLNLLITAIEMRESSDNVIAKLDLLDLLEVDDSDVLYCKALYSLASRAFVLCRYEVSAEKFTQLINYMKSWQADIEAVKCLPALEQLYQEAIQALLKSERYSECVCMCETILQANRGQNSVSDLSVLNDSSLCHTQSQDRSAISTNNNSEDSISKLLTEESSQGCIWSRKRKLSDGQHGSKACAGQDTIHMEVTTLKVKAEALVKLGDNAIALSCLERAADSIKKYRRSLLQTHLQIHEQPALKRRKVDSDSNSANEEVTSVNTFDIEGDIYTLTADILTAQNQHQGAKHFRQLAVHVSAVSELTSARTGER